MVKEGLSEDLTVEQKYKICIYVGLVLLVEGTENAKVLKLQGACHIH